MKLEELLEHTAKDFLDDRTDLVDGDPDELWSNKVVVRYFNEAQRRLCRRAWVLVDTSHPQAGRIVLATGKTLYPLHKSVLKVLAVTPTGQLAPLAHSTDARLAGRLPEDPDDFDASLVEPITPGPPLAISTDAGTRLLRVAPAPAVAQNGLVVALKVARMPSCDLTIDKMDAEPEVPEEWHLEVISKYAAGKCLTHPNVDDSAKTEGRRLLAEVEAAIHEARQERIRLWSAPSKFWFASTTACLG